MLFLWIALGTLAALLLLYLILLAPRTRRRAVEPFLRVPYAHRGLHGGGVPENSLEAFRLAVENGYGIELDVQLSADGVVMVFHDESLLRMTGVDAPLWSKSAAELAALRLAGSDAHIPTLTEVLALVDGRVPLLVEIKSDHTPIAVCEKTAALLDAYAGPYMMESFHPLCVNWFRKNREGVVRGQLSSHLFAKGHRTPARFVAQNLLLNILARPDFIAFCYKDKKLLSFSLCRALYHPYTVAWTLREEEALAASKEFDAVIFENIDKEALCKTGRFKTDEKEEKQ
ncbi:MAG: glycerophosphodiester phosphodiesterase [Clostridia bacterium]|nr:glycerophosphodiester phosphodiesterase [Clostridia bacterium]